LVGRGGGNKKTQKTFVYTTFYSAGIANFLLLFDSEGREILTGAINHSRGVLHGSYKKSLPCGVPQALFCMVKMRYFRGTGMIFPRLALP
jgi:hypothetical protein